jgi:curved DNA-binding protein CbpA
MSSPFSTLGLPTTATPAQIKAAYRQLVKQWHPDRFPPGPKRQEAEIQLKRINLAYNALKSPAPAAPNPTTSTSTSTSTSSTSYEEIYQQGADLAKQGRYEEAIEIFSRLIKVCPTHAQAYRYRGFARSILGFELGAASDLKKADQLESARNEARRTVARSTPNSYPSPQGFLQRIWRKFKQWMRSLWP